MCGQEPDMRIARWAVLLLRDALSARETVVTLSVVGGELHITPDHLTEGYPRGIFFRSLCVGLFHQAFLQIDDSHACLEEIILRPREQTLIVRLNLDFSASEPQVPECCTEAIA